MYIGVAALIFLQTAWAGEPEAVVQDDGTVVVTVSVDATEADVRRILAESADELSTDSRVVQRVDRGDCAEIDRETRGIFRPFRFKALRCPTEDGFEESLVETGDFSAYESQWVVLQEDSGTQVVYRVHTELNHPVPNTVVRQGVLAGAKQAVTNLVRRVLGKSR